MFVGTRKDIVSSPVVHGQISAALDKAFSSHPVWPFVHHDVHGKTGTSGTTTTRLTFFAVNNVKGRGDPVVLRLLNVMQVCAFRKTYSSHRRDLTQPSPPPSLPQRVLSDQEYIKRKVPLSWLRFQDLVFKDEARSSLSFGEVSKMMASCGVATAHRKLLLRFLHMMGKLLWFEEPALRNTIITDPIEYLAKPASTVICKLKQSGNDVTLHWLPVHEKVSRVPCRWSQSLCINTV